MVEKRIYPVHYKLDGEQCEKFITVEGQLSSLSVEELRGSIISQLESDTGHHFPIEEREKIHIDGLDY